MERPATGTLRLCATGLVIGGVLLGCALPAAAAETSAGVQQGIQQDLLQRMQQLEALVKQAQEETNRLRRELDKIKGQPSPPAALQSGTEKPGAAMTAAAAGKTPAASGKPEDDEWAEPEVEQTQGGRDAEARRRLSELEAEMRKAKAEAAKREEEKKGKVAFDFSGKYKVQGNSRNNFNLDNSRQSWEFDNAAFIDHRFQLQMDATYEAVQARLLLDKGNFVFDWKEDGEGTLERWGEFQTVGASLVRELYAQYTGDFIARVGRQSWVVGNAISLEGPIDSIRVDYPAGELPWGRTTVTAGYMAMAGGWKSFTDFRNSGGPPAGDRQELFSAQNKLDAYYLGLDVRPTSSLRVEPYALKVIDRGNAGEADLNLDKDFDATTTVRDGDFEPLWMGMRASYGLEKMKFDAEAVYLTGKYSKTQDVHAYALLLQGSRDFGKVGGLRNLSMGLEFGLGSGNEADDSPSGTVRDFAGLFLCRPRHKYGNIFSEDIRAGYFFWDSNLANASYVRLDTTLEPIKGLKVTPSVAKIWTTESVFEGHGPVGDWSRGLATSTSKTRDVGWEFDLNVTYPILERLEGFLSLGYFLPGAVYARPDGDNPNPAFEAVIGAELRF